MRAKAACHLEYCISKIGADVCSLRELDRLVNVGVKGMRLEQEARHAGRRMLYSLYTHGLWSCDSYNAFCRRESIVNYWIWYSVVAHLLVVKVSTSDYK